MSFSVNHVYKTNNKKLSEGLNGNPVFRLIPFTLKAQILPPGYYYDKESAIIFGQRKRFNTAILLQKTIQIYANQAILNMAL